MEYSFSHFCFCSQTGYQTLKVFTDLCADAGRGYEFPECRLPYGCMPAVSTLGLGRKKGQYLLYFRPSVQYRGESKALAQFFRSSRLYPSFEDLCASLQALAGEFLPSKNGKASPAPAPQPAPRAAAEQKEAPALSYPDLLKALQELVLGQEQAVEAVAFKLYGHIGKSQPARPLSLIFYGPTGVGKSELGKGLAGVLNRQQAEKQYQFIWTELNTFTEPHSVYRLTGSPPGYVGYEDQPVLEAVRRNPCTVFMFDELEKAHPEVLKVFMSILDEGRCSARKEDANGCRELDFRQCVFLFTTNSDLSKAESSTLGFSPSPAASPPPAEPAFPDGGTMAQLAKRLFQQDETGRRALVRCGALKEIAGRFSGIIGFQPLDAQTRVAITSRQIISLGKEYGLHITQVAPEIAEALTPEEALSARSSISVLEGALTSLFLAAKDLRHRQLKLLGTVSNLRLVPFGFILPQETPPAAKPYSLSNTLETSPVLSSMR